MVPGASLVESRSARITSGTALAMRAGVRRDLMEVHRMLAYPSEEITWRPAEIMGIETTGQRGTCEACLHTKRHAVPMMTDERGSMKRQRFFVNVTGSMKHSRLVGNSYVVNFVDDCTRSKVVKFVKKSDTTAALMSLIAD